MRRQVETGDMEPWVVDLHLAQKPPSSACNVEQAHSLAPGRPLLVGEHAFQWDQRLAPHCSGTPAKQNLDLVVVALGRSPAQITICLEMKFLPVIGRIMLGHGFGQKALLGSAVPSLLDRFQIGKEIDRATDLCERIAEPIRRRCIVSGLDVAPILREESPQIGQDPPPVRRRAMLQSIWHRHRTAHAGREQFLPEEPTDARRLRSVEGKFFERGEHAGGMSYRSGTALQGMKSRPRPRWPRIAPDWGAEYYQPACGAIDRPRWRWIITLYPPRDGGGPDPWRIG